MDTQPRLDIRTWLPTLVLLTAVSSPPALGQISAEHQSFASGPAAHWFTAADRAAWKSVKTDSEAEDFIALFWARRDPDPQTAVNELQPEFEARVAYADREFGEKRGKETLRGALSDRGKVLILLGSPTKVSRADRSAFDEIDSTNPGDIGGDPNLSEYHRDTREAWRYERDKLPATLKINQLVVHFETESGYGTSVLAREGKVLSALAQTVENALVRPDVTLAEARAAMAGAVAAAPSPEAGAPAFSAWHAQALGELAPAAQLDALASGEPPLVAFLDAAPFQTHDGSWIVPVQVMARERIADAAPYTLVGRLTSGTEEKLGFQLSSPWRDSKRQSVLQTTVVAPAGSYALTVGVLDPAGKLVWAGKKPLSVPAAASDFWISELVVSNDLGKLAQAQEMLQPWAWEGIAVVPKGDDAFRQGEAFAYYLHACHVGLTASGKPDLRLTVELQGPKKFRGPQQIQPLANGPDCWIVAGGFDLAPQTFPAGEYQIKAVLTDAAAGKSLAASRPFRIEAAAN